MGSMPRTVHGGERSLPVFDVASGYGQSIMGVVTQCAAIGLRVEQG